MLDPAAWIPAKPIFYPAAPGYPVPEARWRDDSGVIAQERAIDRFVKMGAETGAMKRMQPRNGWCSAACSLIAGSVHHEDTKDLCPSCPQR